MKKGTSPQPELVGHQRTFDLARVRGFSDDVFSIAITIIVLQLAVPPLGLADDEVGRQLLDQWPNYLSYAIGFVVIGYYWMNHHRLFELLDRADVVLTWMNLVLLGVVVLMPFPTEVLGNYEASPVAVGFFAFAAFVLGVINTGLWWYATTDGRLVPSRLDPRALQIFRWRSAAFPIVFAIAFGLCMVSVPLAVASMLLIIPAHLVVRAVLGVPPADEERLEAEAGGEEVLGQLRGAEQGERRELSGLVLLGSGSSMERIVSFTDCVYAIAITLMGLHFQPPEQPVATNRALLDYLVGLYDSDLIGYLIGFVVIGFFWTMHHRFFMFIDRQDPTFRALNLVHLAFIALLPFTTQALSTHGDVDVVSAIYALNAGCASLTLSLLWAYASRNDRLLSPNARGYLADPTRLVWLIPLGFFASIPATFVVGDASTVLWWAPVVVFRLHQRRYRARAPSRAPTTDAPHDPGPEEAHHD